MRGNDVEQRELRDAIGVIEGHAMRSLGRSARASGAGKPISAKNGATRESAADVSTRAGSGGCGANRLIPNGRVVFARTAAHAAAICSGVRYAAPIDPSPPASHTAATSSGVSPPPAMGA